MGFGSNIVLDRLNLDIYRGEILGFVGASGTGKSVLMRTVLRLLPRRSGNIRIFGTDFDKATEAQRLALDMKLGVLFQHGALFSSLTVKENIQVPMREYLDLPQALMDELAKLKIELVGLAPEAADKYPSELSGGMIKRAALARALALDPALVFLDEPTSRGGIRRADRQTARHSGIDRVYGDSRPRQPVFGVRPHCRPRAEEGFGRRHDRGHAGL